MSVKKSKGGYVMDFTLNGVRYRESIPAPHNKTVEKRLIEQEAIYKMAITISDKTYLQKYPNSGILQKAFGSNASFTIHEYANIWFKSQQRYWEVSTRRGYEEKYRNHIQYNWGNLSLEEFKPTYFETWASNSTLSNKSINEVRNVMNQIFTHAFMSKVIFENPIKFVKRFKHYQPEPEPFNKNEIDRILSALEEPYSQLYKFAFYTGLRTGELIALRWQDIDFTKNLAHIRVNIVNGVEKAPKTRGSRRTIELLKPAIQALENIRSGKYYSSNRIFVDPETLTEFRYIDKLRKYVWKPALDKAKVKYRKPYQTRHTYASMMLSIGKPAIWVANQLGHTDLNMLQRTYGRWIPNS